MGIELLHVSVHFYLSFRNTDNYVSCHYFSRFWCLVKGVSKCTDNVVRELPWPNGKVFAW